MRFTQNKAGKLPVILLVVAAFCVVAACAGVFVFTKGGKANHSAAPRPKDLKQWKVDDLLVTLADTEELHYLKINISFDIEGKSLGEAGGEGEQGTSERCKALDAINGLLSSRTLKQLIADTGREKLKQDLKTVLNRRLQDAKVHDVYITYFALQ